MSKIAAGVTQLSRQLSKPSTLKCVPDWISAQGSRLGKADVVL